MSPARKTDALGYVDELRDALQSPYMQLLFSSGPDVGTSIQTAIAAQFGNRSTLQELGEATRFVERMNEPRWEMSAQIAEHCQDVRANAFSVVSALGCCRLYGINLPSEISTTLRSPLPVELLVPAIVEVLRVLQIAIDDARTLPVRFANSEPLEDRAHCTSILHLLMELWAVYIVIDDEYQRDLCEHQNIGSPFGLWMHRLLNAFAVLDDELQRDEQIRLLSVTTELPILENWRKMLVDPYRDPLPWWLDGTLETVAEQVERDLARADLFGHREEPVAASPKPRTPLASHPFDLAARDTTENYALAAAPGGLLGEVAIVVLTAAANTGRDPLSVLRDLEIDEPRLQTNPVWCLDKLAVEFPLIGLKRKLYRIFVKHNVYLPPSVVNEILASEDDRNDS